MNWRDRISTAPHICHGKACIIGTRGIMSVILDNLAAGESVEAMMHGDHLEREDIQAALHDAAGLARDRVG